ncbi:hypothetical protein ACQ4PT_010705 [Festuca glaucescens]
MASPSNTQTVFADDGSVTVAAPNGDLWIGSRRFNQNPRSPYNIHNQPGQPANPVNFFSEGEDDDDDDSAPPSQRESASNNDPMPDAADDAARGILRGEPVARRIPPSANPAEWLGSPIPEIFVPQHFIHDVNNLAYALLDGPVRQEMAHIRAALEANPRCPPFVLAPLAFGSALLIFPTNVDRDRAMVLSPFPFEGATVSVVCPEAGEEVSTTTYHVIVELRARKYPLCLWHLAGANFIFGSLGKLCCVDQCCVTGQDFTMIRAFVLLERGKRVPPAAVLRTPNNDVLMVYFDIDNSWLLDYGADAPPPPPPTPRPQTVPQSVSTGTQTDAPASPRAEQDATADPADAMVPSVGTETPLPLGDAGGVQESLLGAIDAAAVAQDAADTLVAHAEELINSMHELSHDSTFSFSAQSSDQAPSHRTRAWRATEAAAKVRRSQRLATKQEARFVGMLEITVNKKAASFDLSAASPSLSRALSATGLVDAPNLPATDDAVRAVARECGTTDKELADLRDTPVPDLTP